MQKALILNFAKTAKNGRLRAKPEVIDLKKNGQLSNLHTEERTRGSLRPAITDSFVAFIYAHTIVLLIAYGIQPELCGCRWKPEYNGVVHLTLGLPCSS